MNMLGIIGFACMQGRHIQHAVKSTNIYLKSGFNYRVIVKCLRMLKLFEDNPSSAGLPLVLVTVSLFLSW